MNILIEYLYRDAGNNKIWGSAILSNKKNIDISVLESNIQKALLDHHFFIAEDVGLPQLSFDHYDRRLDHGWHEYSSIETTESSPDELQHDIYDFIDMLKK